MTTRSSSAKNLDNSIKYVTEDRQDEIDLRELSLVLWSGKLFILLVSLSFATAGAIFALTSPEWWSANARVTKATYTDFSTYQQQVKRLLPLFGNYQNNDEVVISRELDEMINRDKMFKSFKQSFNSSQNKKNYLEDHPHFLDFLSANHIEDVQAKRVALEAWSEKLSLAEIKPKSPGDLQLALSMQTNNVDASVALLQGYINYISEFVKNEAYVALSAARISKIELLRQELNVLMVQAKSQLELEIKRAKVSLEVATNAGLLEPQQNLNGNSMFNLELGSKGTAAMIEALSKLDDLSIVNAAIPATQAKLDLLENIQIDASNEFRSFSYINEVEGSLSRDKPKRALIVILATLLGGMLSAVLVLVRYAFRKKDDDANS